MPVITTGSKATTSGPDQEVDASTLPRARCAHTHKDCPSDTCAYLAWLRRQGLQLVTDQPPDHPT